MRLYRPLLALVTAGVVASGSCVAALAATSPTSQIASSGVAALAGQQRAAVTFAPVVVSGSSATITYSVNRSAGRITGRACALRVGRSRVSTRCGATVATGAGSTSYRVSFADLAPGSYRYTVTLDVRRGPSAQASTTFTVAAPAVNHFPVAVDDRFTVESGGTLGVHAPGILANDTDADGDPLTAIPVNQPTHGALILNPTGSLTYLPGAGFIGTDAFTYLANDGKGLSNLATVTITVLPNRAPVAVDHAYTVQSGQYLSIDAPSLLGGASDPDGDPISLVLPLAGYPSHGLAYIGAPEDNPTFGYQSSAGFVGTDTLTYQVRDDHGNLSNVATVTITVLPNRAPVAVDHAYTVQSGQYLSIDAPSLLGGASDPDGDPISLVLPLAGYPSHGLAYIGAPEGNPTFGYQSNAGFVGTDTLTYQVRDDHGNLSNVATVTITVTP